MPGYPPLFIIAPTEIEEYLEREISWQHDYFRDLENSTAELCPVKRRTFVESLYRDRERERERDLILRNRI